MQEEKEGLSGLGEALFAALTRRGLVDGGAGWEWGEGGAGTGALGGEGLDEALGDLAGGEVGAGGEAEEGAETVAGYGADEIEAFDGGFEVVREDGGTVFAAVDEAAEGVGQEAVAAEVNAEAGAGDDVGGDVLAGFELGVGEDELDAAIVWVGGVHELGFGDGPAEEMGEFSFDAAVERGPAGGAEVFVDEEVANRAGEGLEEAGEIGGEP